MEHEHGSMYRPGGLHPVDLGDRLGESNRFKVTHKLGSGSFATVWLCRDTKADKWVAVKILQAADSDESCPELAIRELLGNPSPEELEANHLTLALEEFWIDGPNGRHLCMVLPLLGPEVGIVGQTFCCNSSLAKQVAHQMAEALTYMHGKGVCHGDFRLENILFKIEGVDSLSEDDMNAMLGEPEFCEVLDDEWNPMTGPHVPKRLVKKAEFPHDSGYVSRKIAVIDFGIAFKTDEFHERGCVPCDYASPEVLLGTKQMIGPPADIWALGCGIWELRTGRSPFPGDDDLLVIQNIEDWVGRLPEIYLSEFRDLYPVFNEELDNTNPLPVSFPAAALEEEHRMRLRDSKTTDMLKHNLMMSRVILYSTPAAYADGDTIDRGILPPAPAYKPDDTDRWNYSMPTAEIPVILDLMRQIFKYNLDDRATPNTIISHEWFQDRKEDWYKPDEYIWQPRGSGKPPVKQDDKAEDDIHSKVETAPHTTQSQPEVQLSTHTPSQDDVSNVAKSAGRVRWTWTAFYQLLLRIFRRNAAHKS